MANAVDYAVKKLPVQTRLHALEEGKRDPRFWGYFTKLATSSDPVRAVDDDMKKAVINELDPSRHRDAAGKWPILRNKMRGSMSVIGQHFAAHGNLSALASFISGLGQEDQFITSLNMEETGTSAPIPGLVTSLDQESPPGYTPIPGLVTSLSPSSSGQAPIDDPSAGEESAAFKESLDHPASPGAATAAASAAAGAAPAVAKAATAQRPAPAPAAPAGPSIWATIASALTTAGGAGAAIYSQEVQKQAATKAQQTLLSAQQQAAARAQQAAAIANQGILGTSGATSYVVYGLLGLLGVGGLLMLFKAMSGGKGRGR